MLTVEEARERILNLVSPLEPEEKPILEAQGQVLAEDISAPFDVPPLDNSAMDGYAVRWEDIQGVQPSSPRLLRIVGEVAAGYLPPAEVTPSTTIRIMTGAPIPTGADTVVPFEDTDETEQRQKPWGGELKYIRILQEAPKGANIRRAGEDIVHGQLVLRKGTALRPGEIGVLASLGRATVQVIRRPVVAILATGDELVMVGQPLPPGKIYNSNSYSLASQVLRNGGIPKPLGIARDDLEELRAKVRQGLDADLFLSSAGVSTGYYDVVKEVLAQEGEINFWTVKMKPGKPLAFGLLRGEGVKKVPHLGLPGNPVSSMITFELFARPAILKMLGKKELAKPIIEAILEEKVINRDGRRFYARARVEKREGQYYARTTGPQGSGILTSMAYANGLVILPEDCPQASPGDRVKVMMLDWPEEMA